MLKTTHLFPAMHVLQIYDFCFPDSGPGPFFADLVIRLWTLDFGFWTWALALCTVLGLWTCILTSDLFCGFMVLSFALRLDVAQGLDSLGIAFFSCERALGSNVRGFQSLSKDFKPSWCVYM